MDWASDMHTDSGDNVDGLKLIFNGADGLKIELGRVTRLESYSRKATAFVGSGDAIESLLPDDNRWDTVVGTLDRAITTCYENKAKRR